MFILVDIELTDKLDSCIIDDVYVKYFKSVSLLFILCHVQLVNTDNVLHNIAVASDDGDIVTDEDFMLEFDKLDLVIANGVIRIILIQLIAI